MSDFALGALANTSILGYNKLRTQQPGPRPMVVTQSKEPNPTDKHVGARIRMRRMMVGLSQTKLADAVDVTFQQVQKYEKGVNRVSASRMQQFAKILSVPISFFFEGSPPASVVGSKSGATATGMPAYVREFLAIRDGVKITKAFTQIRNQKLRRAVVALVEQIADSRER
jgi:transcriptional regulator with XRE-family HTH domain